MKAEVAILDWMLANRVGAHQTTFEHMVRRIPSDSKYGSKATRAALENLIRKGFISTKRKHYDIQISLITSKLDQALVHIAELESKLKTT
jgi:hypothetical protein